MKKKYKVVMLPTDEVSKILIEDRVLKSNPSGIEVGGNVKYQHIYILSDEDIKEGDWYINFETEDFYQCINEDFITCPSYIFRKIIASSNESLGLPRPSNEFLKIYCKAGGINEIEVECIEYGITCDYEDEHGLGTCNKVCQGMCSHRELYKLKIAPDNTININPIKNSWNREEVIELIKDFNSETVEQRGNKCLNNWIKENL